jgi:IrrE N-terminal-like domain
MYWQDGPRVFISALRPAGRQAFNCAHGFGHHVFGHGNCITSVNTNGSQPHFNEQEFLADAFASSFLMPRTTVSHGFSVRGWSLEQCTPAQAYIVAGWLGVGYTTLIHHMRDTLRLLSPVHAELLLKRQPKDVRAQLVEKTTNNNLVVVDQHWTGRPIDLEVGDLLMLPPDAEVVGNEVELVELLNKSKLFRAVAPGAGSRVEIADPGWSAFVRVSRPRYCGRNLFRHLDDPDYAL